VAYSSVSCQPPGEPPGAQSGRIWPTRGGAQILERVASLYRDIGWPAEVAGDAFTARYSAPSAGPPPGIFTGSLSARSSV
jgi:hypothetical protein